MVTMDDIRDAVLVVAHPDDEILWFSSILQHCKAVVVCFGPSATSAQISRGREKFIAGYPLAKARFLQLPESGAFGTADWEASAENGLRLRRSSTSYEHNSAELVRILRPLLDGERLVLTHNPWGEYGHEEHVQVSNAVAALGVELGLDVLVSGYVSNRSCTRMLNTPVSGPPLVLGTDIALAAELKKLYIDNGCWTWMDDYVWPEWEAFYRVRESAGTPKPGGVTPPLTYINHNFKPTWLRRKAARALPAPVKSRLKRLLRRN